MLCSETTLIAHEAGIAVTRFCGRWACEICEWENKAKLAHRVFGGLPNAFITLSSNPHWQDTPDEAARKLVCMFRLMRQRACRKYRLPHFDFHAVFERTERGEPHLHIAARFPPHQPYSPHKKLTHLPSALVDLQCWISNVMGEIGSAPNVSVRDVYNATGLAVYMSKGPAKFEGCKRHWSSRAWVLNRREKQVKLVWELSMKGLDGLECELGDAGIPYRRETKRRLKFFPP